jgi:hypothetical protein
MIHCAQSYFICVGEDSSRNKKKVTLSNEKLDSLCDFE